jgi:hypothetical protein
VTPRPPAPTCAKPPCGTKPRPAEAGGRAERYAAADEAPSAGGQAPDPQLAGESPADAKAAGAPTPSKPAGPAAGRQAAPRCAAPRRDPGPASPPSTPPGTGQPRPDGNAIYRIDADGFVTEVFRQRALVLAMAERDGVLFVATGSEGLVYQVNPAWRKRSSSPRSTPSR